jgi:arylformamidase
MDGIYRGFSQAELDLEYMPTRHVQVGPFVEAYAKGSAHARETLEWRSIAYGPAEAETVDFFPAKVPNAPLHVFIHGGYWRMLSKRESSFAAPGFVEAGAAFAAVDYTLVPHATLDDIVRQVRTAIAHLHVHAAELGIDRTRIHVSGSSAGGHLTGMLLASDWQDAFGVPADVVRGGTPVSGLMDLEPVRLCCVNEWMKFDVASVARNSPMARLPAAGTHVIAAVGALETDEFKRQTLDYGAACRASGLTSVDLVVPDRHHFNVILDLGDPQTTLGRLVFDQMGLA